MSALISVTPGPNQLTPVYRFGFTPQGSPPAPTPGGTDYRHRTQRYFDLNKPWVEFGFQPVGSTGLAPPTPTPVVGGPTVAGWGNLRELHGAWERRRYRCEQEAERLLELERRLELKAAVARSEKEAAALLAAADAAKQVAEEIERCEIEAHIGRLTRALNAAAGAARIGEIIRESNLAVEYARKVLEEFEEEEAAEMLLLN